MSIRTIFSTVTSITVLGVGVITAEESGFPQTNQYQPGELISVFNGVGRMSRIGFHQGWLYTESQSGGAPARAWDVLDIENPTMIADFGEVQPGAHNFGYAEGAITFSYLNNSMRADTWRGMPQRVSVYSGAWEGGMSYTYPIGIQADSGYITQNANRNLNFNDLRNGNLLGSYNPYADAGIIGKPLLIGNLLIVAGMQHTGGVATYDVSDLSNPVLLDVLPNIGGYEPTVWGDYLVLANGSAAEAVGLPWGITFVDISDPSNLSIAHQMLAPNFYSFTQEVQGDTRYAQYQDEFMFIGNSKIDLTTFEVVQTFTAPGIGNFEEYPMPFGNFLALGAHSDGEVHIFCHQSEPDTRGPMVNHMNPRPNTVNVPVTARVGFLIPETLDATSLVNGDTIVVRPVGGQPIDCLIGASHDDIITVYPTQQLADNTTYEVVLRAGGIRDVALNPLEETVSWSFSTGPTIDGGDGNQLPQVSITAPANGSVYDNPQSITITANASDPDGTVDRVEFLVDGMVVATDTTPPYSTDWSATSGSHAIRARVYDDQDASTLSATIAISVNGPFDGSAGTLPGRIEAEHYDIGGEGVAYHDLDIANQGGAYRTDGVDIEVCTDTGGGFNVGYMEDGEWLRYGIQVASAMTAEMSFRIASDAADPGSLQVRIDGVLAGEVDIPSTGGWQNWQTVTLQGVEIPANASSIRLDVVGGGFNLNYFEAASVVVAPEINDITVSDYPGTPGEALTISADAAGSGLEYRWTLGDDTPRTDWGPASSITHTYDQAGHYNLVLQIRNSAGTTATATRIVTVSPVPAVGPGRSSGPIALDGSARRVVVANPDNGSVAAVNADSLSLQWEVPVGADPRGVAIDGSGNVWVAVRDDHQVVVLDGGTGSELARINLPYGAAPVQVLFDGSGTGYVSCEGSGRLGRIDRDSRSINAWIDLEQSARALALSADGNQLWVTRFRSTGNTGRVWRIDTGSFSLAATISLAIDPGPDTPSDSRGVINYLAQAAVDPFADALWLPSVKHNVERGNNLDGEDLNHENTVRTGIAFVGVADDSDRVNQRWDLDNADSATAVAFSPLGDYVFTTLQGLDMVQVSDRFNGARVARLGVGAAPQGIVYDTATDRIFVKNFMSRDISVIAVGNFLERGTPLSTDIDPVATVGSESLEAEVLLGKQIFYLAGDERMSSEGYVSCASCHTEGKEDGLVWDFTQRGEGMRNTITLNGRRGTGHGRVHWSGNFDEIQDFEHDIRSAFAGAGFLSEADFNNGTTNTPLGDPKAGLSPELDALAAYLASLDSYGDSPHRNPDGSMTAEAIAGEAIFKRLDCATCHSGADFTDSAQGFLHDVGTITAASGNRLSGELSGIDTPTLRGLWETAPYFHDGSAATLHAVVNRGDSNHGSMASLSQTEKDQLVAYLQQLDGANTNPGIAEYIRRIAIGLVGQYMWAIDADAQESSEGDAQVFEDLDSSRDHVLTPVPTSQQ